MIKIFLEWGNIMTQEYLLKLKEKINQLSEEEKQERNLYLRNLANGTLQGPPVGQVEIDRQWLKFHSEEALKTDFVGMSAYNLLYTNNKDYLDEEFAEYFGTTFTYRDLFREIDIVAKSLLEIGVCEEDMVIMSLPNSPEATFLFYALNKIGAIVNTIDPRYSINNLKDTIEESNAKYFFGTSMMMKNLKRFKKQVKIISVSPFKYLNKKSGKILAKVDYLKNYDKGIMTWDEFIKKGQESNIKNIPNIYKKDFGNIICHTGGSTGTPKGVVLTNENFNALIYQLLNNNVGLERGLTFLNILPTFVAMGLDDGLHLAACGGIKQILIPSVKPEDFPKMVLKYKPNLILCGPVHLDQMMQQINDDIDLSFLKIVMFGGGEYEISKQQKFNEFLTKHGASNKLYSGYGATETASGSSCQKDSCYELGCIGAPYINMVCEIHDPDTGELLNGLDAQGELYITGPTLMQGYYGYRQAETNEVIYTDEFGERWYKTGDLCHFNENSMLVFDGRIKRIIIRSAYKIYPQYIESLFLQNKYISECAVVGIPDEHESMLPVANIVIKEEYRNDEKIREQIKQFCDGIVIENVSEFAVMAGYNFLDNLPLTPIGKLDFKKLEKMGIIDNDSHLKTKKRIKGK